MKINKLILIFIFLSLCINQNFEENSIELLNSSNNLQIDRFTINQSFGLSVSSMNGMSASNAIYTNNFNYKLSEKLNLKSNIHLISPTIKNYNNTNNLNVKYDFLLDYKISNNFEFKMKISNLHFPNGVNNSSYFHLLND